MKYVMTDFFGIKIPIIFPEQYCHNMFKDKFIITSAGYINIEASLVGEYDDLVSAGLTVKCLGNSTSLNMKPDSKDEQIIDDFLNLGESAAIAIQRGIDVHAILRNVE